MTSKKRKSFHQINKAAVQVQAIIATVARDM